MPIYYDITPFGLLFMRYCLFLPALLFDIFYLVGIAWFRIGCFVGIPEPYAIEQLIPFGEREFFKVFGCGIGLHKGCRPAEAT